MPYQAIHFQFLGMVIAVLIVAMHDCSFASEATEPPEAESTRVQRPVWDRYGRSMGTSYRVRWIPVGDTGDAESLQSEVQSELDRIEQIFSLYKPESELNRWNRSRSTEWQVVAPEIVELLEVAQVLHRATEGRFDPTVGPLTKLWNINSLAPGWAPPALPRRIETLRHVGLEKLEWKAAENAIRKRVPECELDLNALVEGLALRNLARILQERGLSDYLLELGGEFYASGTSVNGEAWFVGIETPSEDHGKILRSIENQKMHLSYRVGLSDEAIGSSGSYKSRRIFEGKTYSHFIDAISGEPTRFDTIAVSVVHRDPIWADGWASALMMADPKMVDQITVEHRLQAVIASSDSSSASIRWRVFPSSTNRFQAPTSPNSVPTTDDSPSGSPTLPYPMFMKILLVGSIGWLVLQRWIHRSARR